MATEPQRDIEQDLLAYKQRRREQAGAPLELHPATRKMLQSEAARSVSRPLLTSEEAAKNFVRSFVMSHQQPGFFARNKHRVLWAGAMFACLAVVLAVLRNDPRQAEQQRLFTDSLPTPPPAAEPQPTPSRPIVVANPPSAEPVRLARDTQAVPVRDEPPQVAKLAAAPPASSAPVSSPTPKIATAPMSAAQRETLNRRSGAAAAPQPSASTFTSNDRSVSTTAPVAALSVAKADLGRLRVVAPETDRQLAEKAAAGEATPLAKTLKAAEASEAKAASDELKRPASGAGAVGGGGGVSLGLNPVVATATPPLAGYVVAEPVPVRQRFQQLDNQAGYRKNFNSPPVPQVLQDFAFERTGDRVRIVDTDGSTYEGSVMPTPTEASRLKGAGNFDVAEKRKDANVSQAQPADPQATYRFYANGVNLKLKQSVEFRGEWQPAAQSQSSPAAVKSALQPVTFSGVLSERLAAEKKEPTVLSNSLAGPAATALNFNYQQSQNAAAPGRISGRAVVGGKNEFDINAVPK